MPSQQTILFIGSNPSSSAASNEAFTADTVSGRILREWIQGIEGTMIFENIVSQKTENNRPLNSNERALAQVSLLERINRINPTRLVALGKTAASVLAKLELEYLEMPHPSGLNRKLNDRQYVEEKIYSLKCYCK
jgi:uracil-DNA glycosylase